MRWTGLLLAFAAVLAKAAAATKTSESICTLSGVTTQCTCNENVAELTLGPGDLARIGVGEKFVVQQCKKLEIKKNAFKDMHNLKNLFINNVLEVYMKPGAFEVLQVLKMENIKSLNLEISTFQGAHGISSIYIKNTSIPELPKWSLIEITGLREFHLENVQIDTIKTDSVMLSMSSNKSDVILRNCTVAKIEENAIEINSTINFVMDNCIMKKAAKNSMSIRHQNYAYLTNNIFKKDVEVDALHISGHQILFKDNLVEVLTPDAIKQSASRQSRSFHGFDELIVHGKNNSVTCECPLKEIKADLSEDVFKDNSCLHGCSSATVSAFLESCSRDKHLKSETRIENLCPEGGHVKPPSTSTEEVSNTPDDKPPTNKPFTENLSTHNKTSNAVRNLETAGLSIFIATVILFY